jgi:hypothetical protein
MRGNSLTILQVLNINLLCVVVDLAEQYKYPFTMKLFSFLSLLAAASALPAAIDLAPRASMSKVDGLKFNIDGVTKCKSRTLIFHIFITYLF